MFCLVILVKGGYDPSAVVHTGELAAEYTHRINTEVFSPAVPSSKVLSTPSLFQSCFISGRGRIRLPMHFLLQLHQSSVYSINAIFWGAKLFRRNLKCSMD